MISVLILGIIVAVILYPEFILSGRLSERDDVSYLVDANDTKRDSSL